MSRSGQLDQSSLVLMVPVYSLPPASSSLSFFVVGVRPRTLFGSTARYEERRRMSADDRAKATVVEPRPPRCALGSGGENLAGRAPIKPV